MPNIEYLTQHYAWIALVGAIVTAIVNLVARVESRPGFDTRHPRWYKTLRVISTIGVDLVGAFKALAPATTSRSTKPDVKP